MKTDKEDRIQNAQKTKCTFQEKNVTNETGISTLQTVIGDDFLSIGPGNLVLNKKNELIVMYTLII